MEVIDGGMGHLLRRKGVEIKGEIGSMERFLGVALANIDNRALVEECHAEYLRAGARWLTTNSYSCVPSCLSLSQGRPGSMPSLDEIIAEAGRAARAAIDASPGDAMHAKVLGCVPPLSESYRSDRVQDDAVLDKDYSQIVAAVAPFSDALLCETMSLAREARVAATAASATGLPVWVAFTLHEDGSGNLRSGETIAETIAQLKDAVGVEACLLNCCTHESICAALPQLRAAIDATFPAEHARKIQIGAYANGFKTVAAGAADGGAACEYQEDLTPAAYAARVLEWQALGATITGGCCGVFPEHIEEVAKTMQKQQHERQQAVCSSGNSSGSISSSDSNDCE